MTTQQKTNFIDESTNKLLMSVDFLYDTEREDKFLLLESINEPTGTYESYKIIKTEGDTFVKTKGRNVCYEVVRRIIVRK